ncbi:BREX-1 system phosphatase PglZ type A [Cyanobacteria bacterium FACHB-502]|nr:BREX-1 system phosphatase PglZ type A [Cyanobacteria bacterium FACHB-502]
MENRIAQALTRLFERHRIIFWYDVKRELRADFEGLQLAGVEKIELTNNEFGVKYRILREQPAQKFLLYREGSQPDDLDNWLLDVQLAHGEFRTDQIGLWLSELELGLDFADVVQAHAEFYRAIKRKDALKRLLKPDDTPGMIRLKMLAVCAGSEPRIDSVLENLLAELSDKRDEKIKLIQRCSLDKFLWEQMKRHYGYDSKEPGIQDFSIELFKSCYAMGTDGQVQLTSDAIVFLKRWKDSRQFEESFETLSEECAEILGIEHDLGKRDFRELLELDYFRLIDQKIVSDLVRAVASRTVSSGDVTLWVRQRRQGHWYREFQHLYEAVDYASQFIHALDEANLTMDSLTDGIERYTRSWFRIDQLYRKFVYHVRGSGQASLMATLSDQIEKLYSNNYLLKVNDRWQSFVDVVTKWEAASIPLQKNFFKRWVQPFLEKDNKVYVIISDAFRYEIGDELLSLIRQEDRYDATLEPALSMLPSYTQLGMAALLPNTVLTLADNQTGTVEVDGQSSQGTANRIKILDRSNPQRATAIKAEELMALNREDCRSLVRDHDVVYIYHNRIDSTGKPVTEDRVFDAVEETLQELIRLIKKLTGANASNLLVTSDHGFIYQNQAIEESDFAQEEAEGNQILFRDRRFVLGKGLKEKASFRKFQSSELALKGDIEVLIPKSINRLRLKGSSIRFVHGGASLQEVVIPVIRINKKRQSDISTVEVEIIRGSNSAITSGQVAVTLYQAQPVTDKVQSRNLRAGIYTQSGDLISDSHDLTFDLTSDNPRERELQVRFVLTRKADDANGQEVILRLDEKLTGTSHYKEYKSLRYMMRRSFTSDFDF